MIKTTITIQEVLVKLNELTKKHSHSMRNLVEPDRQGIGALDFLNFILGTDDESKCGAIAANFDVECSRCYARPTQGQIIGDSCFECKNELVTGELHGFALTEQGLNAIAKSRGYK